MFLSGVEMVQQPLRLKKACKRRRFASSSTCRSSTSSLRSLSTVLLGLRAVDSGTGRQGLLSRPGATMVPLYASENGVANRSWGFKRDLPHYVAPNEGEGTAAGSRCLDRRRR